jgi:hypothetical protein
VKLALLQHHLEPARLFVGELLEEEVEKKAGERYSHDDYSHDETRYSRWSKKSGERPHRRGKSASYGAPHD